MTEHERFWSKVKIADDDECWDWQGKVWSGQGKFVYGQFRKSDRTMTKPSRMAYLLSHNCTLPKTIFVCHTCDNGLCCNPNHLFTGTAKDNTQDCIAKGRFRKGGCVGSNNGRSVLTERDVISIRKEYSSGNFSQKYMSEKYNVNPTTISVLLRGKTWRHLNDSTPLFHPP